MGELHNILTLELIQMILKEYQLSRWGVHGITHWARVLENGLRLASYTGARIPVVALFAVFHDSRRNNESKDPGHGKRGAKFAKTLNGKVFDLSEEDFALLETACAYHTDSMTSGDITVQTCWDSDRLDLGRVGIVYDLRYLFTDAAKQPELMKWACERSRARFEPEICRQWGICRWIEGDRGMSCKILIGFCPMVPVPTTRILRISSTFISGLLRLNEPPHGRIRLGNLSMPMGADGG